MSAIDIRKRLYDAGKFAEALSEALEERAALASGPERGELAGLITWSLYRLERYQEALQWATLGWEDGNVWSQECVAYVYAYAKGFQDQRKLLEVAARVGNTTLIDSAVVIWARQEASTIGTSEVLKRVRRHQEHDVLVGNLWYNGAQYFLGKGNDAELALEMMDGALERYGEGELNLHHRAGALFHRSKILAKLGRKDEAVAAAEASEVLWAQQCKASPDDETHVRRREGVRSWLRELGAAVVLVALALGHYAVAAWRAVLSLAA